MPNKERSTIWQVGNMETFDLQPQPTEESRQVQKHQQNISFREGKEKEIEMITCWSC